MSATANRSRTHCDDGDDAQNRMHGLHLIQGIFHRKLSMKSQESFHLELIAFSYASTDF